MNIREIVEEIWIDGCRAGNENYKPGLYLNAKVKKLASLLLDKEKIKSLIQEAWNAGDKNSQDKFGDFLDRAAEAICQSVNQNPKEIFYDGDYHCSKCNKTFPISEQSEFLKHQLDCKQEK